MEITKYCADYFSKINQNICSLDYHQLKEFIDLVLRLKLAGNKIIIVGNGGSAAIASHVAVDFTKAARIRTVNFNEASVLTCFANDYGYEHWVARALEFYADPKDLVILISSSGKSPNILNGAQQAKKMGLSLITLSGFSIENPLRKLGDVNLWVNSEEYNIVEMTHNIWLLAVVDYIVEYEQNIK